MFRIPYYSPGFEPGLQLVNFGQGGPASHIGLLATQPRSYPSTYGVRTYGVGAMPRQIFRPLPYVQVNAYSNPITINNLQISGIMKNPVGG